ncbi:MAG: OmpA family protein [Bacteroidota bacterium]
MKNLLALILLSLLFLPLTAQDYHTRSKKALKYYESAREKFQYRNDAEAESLLKKAIGADQGFVEAYIMLSQICLDAGREGEASAFYLKALELDPEAPASGYLKLAGVEYTAGEYAKAQEHLKIYFNKGGATAEKDLEAGDLLKRCTFALDALAHPVPFNPQNLGPAVNSDLMEYWPSLSVDEQVLYFTVMVAKNPQLPLKPGNIQEDFFYSIKEGDEWGYRMNLGTPINTLDNEGAQTVTADGQQLFFTACNRPDGKGQCDIYTTRFEQGKWTKPVSLGSPLNTSLSEKHPSISADGRFLFFASNRPGGKGDYDIWMSTLGESGWGTPVNLGDSVNTAGTEQSPDIHADNQTLYFASDGWPGMGRSDLFVARKNSAGEWGRPENIGYPINTVNEELGMFVNAEGNRAYFASNRRAGTDTDLYAFDLPVNDRPVPVSYMHGRVYDAGNMRSLGAVIQLIDLENGEVVMETTSGKTDGEYLVCLPSGRDYALNISRQGYLFYSGNFSLEGSYTRLEPFEKDVPLEPVQAGKILVLNNIFYETDSYELDPRSRTELDKVVEFMKQNPKVIIEIAGHTDLTGSAAYNRQLSSLRAGAVVNYLLAQGISGDRLKSAGYGHEKPVATNETEEGRALNRRTELVILSNDR